MGSTSPSLEGWNFDAPSAACVQIRWWMDRRASKSSDQSLELIQEQRYRSNRRGRCITAPWFNDAFPSAAAEQVLLGAAAAAAEASKSSRDQAVYLAGGARGLITTRRACAATLLVGLAVSAPAVRADETGSGAGDEGVIGAIKSIFDPNEKTKAGKVLPKAYLKAAREVVRTLRDSLEEDDGGDIARFRRNADAAKESIREFLGWWRGQQAVAAEESYVALEKAIRSLAEFYSKAGPSASLPQEVKNNILDDLNTAEAYL